MARFIVEVINKASFRNPHADHVAHDINELGLAKHVEVQYAPVYSFDGDITSVDANKIAEKLLIDPVTEEYSISDKKVSKGYFKIEVWFKKGVTDTVAQSITKAARDLSITKNFIVKTGHNYYLKGNITKAIAEEIASKILYNPIIQIYRIN